MASTLTETPNVWLYSLLNNTIFYIYCMNRLIPLIFLSIPSLFAQNYADYVRPLVGTGGHGHTYPGATLPHGMVQLSPDTRVDGSWDGCSGYHFSDQRIYGFSHTHLSGTGCSDYGDIMLMPVTRKSLAFSQEEYVSSYDHADELAQAGFYSVKLKDNHVTVNLTATQRTGFHQYIFHEKEQAMVVLNLNHRDQLLEGEIEMVNDHTISGYRYSKAWAQNQKIFYYIEFSRKIVSAPALDDGEKLKSFQKINGQQLCANFFFDVKTNDTLLIKVGISGTGVEGAKLNLTTENPGWNFKNIREKARQTWNKELGKIEVSADKKSDYEVFYTALYHTMIVPNVWNDVDGKYRGRDDQVHTKEGNYYTVFSLWDTFRAAHPLYTLIDQQRTKDYVQTFILQFKESGRLPVWELSGNETECMIGIHSISVIADAVNKGLVDKQYKNVLADAMIATSKMNEYRGIGIMNKQNHLTIENESESVSKTLEYCYQYHCMSQICKWAGRETETRNFELISMGYKNLFDREVGFFVPRSNGGWLADFDPRQVNNCFTEANAWQYAFFVPHDVTGMIALYGGKEKFHQKLDSLFGTSSKMTGRDQADITGLIGQYAHGNEPSHHVAYLYNYIGDFKKTSSLVSKICTEFYSNKEDGLSGNEDCGQMSAWYVLSSIGLYQVNPGSPYYTLAVPQFQSITMHLENGLVLSIQKDMGEINSISWNGEPLNRLYLSYDDIMQGGLLRFESEGNGIKEGNILFTSQTEGPTYIAAPVIKIESPVFKKETWVEILADNPTVNSTFYSISYPDGKVTKTKYAKKFKIKSNCTITAYTTFGLSGNNSPEAVGKCYLKPNDYSIQINSTPKPEYFAGGADGLLDGINGDVDWHKGFWQGYQGQDFEAIIDLKKSIEVKMITCTFLQDQKAWIVIPPSVEFWGSEDGTNYELIQQTSEISEIKREDVFIKPVSCSFTGKKFRYIKIKAIGYGKLPEWHPGAGEPSYIFIDEIKLE
jgi:predicted alpha-1,2-mannosidase